MEDVQCLPLRGSNEQLGTCGNPGNFLAFLKELSKADVVLKRHLEHPRLKNAKYLSPKSQNELIGHLQIQETTILQEIRQAKFYAILADEVTINPQP